MRFVPLFVILLACGTSTMPRGGDDGVDIDAATDNGGDDAPTGGGGVTIPTWMLEDIQPASPRVGQTYGLDAFTNQIIVVSLLEGF